MPIRGDIVPSARVKRKLWAVDHDQQDKGLREHMAILDKKNMNNWNFDFQCETPLTTGRWLWEPVRGTDIPECYKMEGLSFLARRTQGLSFAKPQVPKVKEMSERENNTTPTCTERVSVKRKSTECQNTAKSPSTLIGQTLITDFYQQRKADTGKRRRLEL